MEGTTFEFEVGAHGATTARSYRAKDPIDATLILAHGAGASQSHPFMVDMATRLTARGIDVVTFDFLYMTRGKKLPDRVEVLLATWHAAIASVRARSGVGAGRLLAGGKSMGGRIASHVAAADRSLRLSGLVFLGYPLHPIDKPKVRRDAHLPSVPFRMLFVQGSRDELGNEKEMRALVKTLPQATLHVVKGGDHSLALPKKDGAAAQEDALEGAADAILAFAKRAQRRSR
ncbi:MAG: alpha/beta fold hydrolase [Deltaproteobacteria bacterium]|nr:alpha/beta fold hydrolase [Deltaproteobacteria bacterium]